jgi:hypothetical protein
MRSHDASFPIHTLDQTQDPVSEDPPSGKESLREVLDKNLSLLHSLDTTDRYGC